MSTTLRYKLLRSLLLLSIILSTSFALVPGASANVKVPGGNFPYYARISRGEVYHTDDWAAIVFYRPPDCIPAGFNLLDFFDVPAAFACNPPTTEGFEIWANGPGIDPAPKLSVVDGLGAVPVWFVSWPALQTAITDDMLTIEELASLNPLKGSASFYHEVLRPTQAVRVGSIELNAVGTLEDGRSFKLHAQGIGKGQELLIHSVVQIDFE